MSKDYIQVKDIKSGEMKLMFLPKNIISSIHNTIGDIDPKNELFVVSKVGNKYKITKRKKLMTKRQLKKSLKEKFPESVFDDGYNFNPEYKDSIWVKGGIYDEEGEPMLDIVSYDDGVHPDLKQILDDTGWFCYWVSSEIVLICEKEEHDS